MEKQVEIPGTVQPTSANSPPYLPQGINPSAPPYQPQTVIVAAPQTQVISRDPTIYREQWLSPFCGCCSSDECCYAFFCPMCFKCQVAAKFGDGCCEATFCVPAFLYRSVYRHKKRIAGSHCNDIFADLFCHICTMVQLSEEHKKRGGVFDEENNVQVQYVYQQ